MKPSLFAVALVFAASPAFATTIPVPEPGVSSLLGAAAVGAVLLWRLRQPR